ncbi:conserved hypothetical protein [Ricinus communis]|uniref:Uncharacterized protein n=1 Tax=Ricinus communis TaxID=3988 RepID=B9RPW5_RICCO|nr:conserved hypothetical protein [Ricinus communis]
MSLEVSNIDHTMVLYSPSSGSSFRKHPQLVNEDNIIELDIPYLSARPRSSALLVEEI